MGVPRHGVDRALAWVFVLLSLALGLFLASDGAERDEMVWPPGFFLWVLCGLTLAFRHRRPRAPRS